MTLDEALQWVDATENERWKRIASERDDARGTAYSRNHAECLGTLAAEVRRLQTLTDILRANMVGTDTDLSRAIGKRDAVLRELEAQR